MLLIEDRLEAAKSHLAAGRVDSATLLFESVLDQSPSNVTALRELASLKLRSGDLQKAHNLATEAALHAAGDSDVLTLLAKTKLFSDQEEQASATLDQALAVDPCHPEACKLKAGLLMQQANPRKAEELLGNALERHPDNPDLLAALSELYMQCGIAAPALELSQKALAFAPDRAEFMGLVGAQLAELGDHEKAIGFFERAHLKEPGNALFLIKLADSQIALGELTAAHGLTKRLLSLFPNLLPAWASYAKVMTYRGEAQAGLIEFAAVARQHPERIASVLTLAAAYRIAGNPTQALRFVEPLTRQSATLKPGQKAHLMSLIRDCSLSLGMFDKVAATFPDFDPRAALGLPARHGTSEAGSHMSQADAELAAALDSAPLIVDAGLSTLEAMTLLRFRQDTRKAGNVSEILGPSRFAEIVALMENALFSPADVPANGATREASAFPLTRALALPEAVRGRITDALPYMHAPEERREIWRRSLETLPRPLVALAWDQTRPGILLQDYRPLIEGFEGTLVSVMWDESRHQLAGWSGVIDAGVHFTSLADLAAVIAETDAIIGPDGIPLHLAGAMGRPGALLTFPNTPWYWYAEDGASAWYPSIAVLKSQSFGNWETKLPELLPEVETFLQRLAPTSRPPLARDHQMHRQPVAGSN